MLKMANEMHGILFGNVQPVSGGVYRAEALGEESFLQDVVSPIYEVMRKVVTSNSSIKLVPLSCKFGELLKNIVLIC